jgi:hypothetical protein
MSAEAFARSAARYCTNFPAVSGVLGPSARKLARWVRRTALERDGNHLGTETHVGQTQDPSSTRTVICWPSGESPRRRPGSSSCLACSPPRYSAEEPTFRQQGLTRPARRDPCERKPRLVCSINFTAVACAWGATGVGASLTTMTLRTSAAPNVNSRGPCTVRSLACSDAWEEE